MRSEAWLRGWAGAGYGGQSEGWGLVTVEGLVHNVYRARGIGEVFVIG